MLIIISRNNFFFIFFLLNTLLVAGNIQSTAGEKSPVVNAKNVELKYYGNTYLNKTINTYKERIGSKIAIRRIFLIPSIQFNQQDSFLYENAEVYLELQSISSQPLLVTSAKINVVNTKLIRPKGRSLGIYILSDKITHNVNRKLLLFEPGEVKIVQLAQSFRFDGIMNFMNNNVDINTQLMPFRPYTLSSDHLVQKLNNFFQSQYGEKAALHIRIFEKDFQPLIDTTVFFSNGGTMFSEQDIEKNNYTIDYGGFLGEIVNVFQKGEEDSFQQYFMSHNGNLSY